jgi:hypothetical protein
MKSGLLTMTSLFFIGMATVLAPVGDNPAHAGPVFSNQSSAHTRKSTTNAQRLEAAKRAAERRAAAKKAMGGAK